MNLEPVKATSIESTSSSKPYEPLQRDLDQFNALFQLLEVSQSGSEYQALVLSNVQSQLQELETQFSHYSSILSLNPSERFTAHHMQHLIKRLSSEINSQLAEKKSFSFESYQTSQLYLIFIHSFMLMPQNDTQKLLHLNYASQCLLDAFDPPNHLLIDLNKFSKDALNLAKHAMRLDAFTPIFHQFLSEIPQSEPKKEALNHLFQRLFDCTFKAKVVIHNASLHADIEAKVDRLKEAYLAFIKSISTTFLNLLN